MRWERGSTTERRLEALRARIEHWRRTRQRSSPMPEELWGEAAFLAQSLEVYPVARALRLSYESLKRHVAEAEGRLDASAECLI